MEEKISKFLKIMSRVRARGLVQVLTSARCQGQSRTRALPPHPSAFCSCCGGITLNIKLEMVKSQLLCSQFFYCFLLKFEMHSLPPLILSLLQGKDQEVWSCRKALPVKHLPCNHKDPSSISMIHMCLEHIETCLAEWLSLEIPVLKRLKQRVPGIY